MPDTAALGDVAALGGIDGVQVSDALAMFRILAIGDVHLVAVDHGRRDDFVARLRPNGFLGVHVEFPKLLAGHGFVAARPAVAFADHHLHHITDLAYGGRRPLAVQNALPNVIDFPDLLAGFLVHRD